jgi:hypothetical protein
VKEVVRVDAPSAREQLAGIYATNQPHLAALRERACGLLDRLPCGP